MLDIYKEFDRVSIPTVYAKALERTGKKVDANFDIPLK